MILYYFGPDTFRSRQKLRESIEQFKKQRDPQGYNVVQLDGKKQDIGRILTEISTAPFLAAKRLIVLENILSSSDKELLGTLVEKMKNKKIPDTNVVIFWQGEPLSKVKEAKELEAELKKEKYAREFAALTEPQLIAWISAEAQTRGGTIDHAGATYLATHSSQDLWLLSGLINQLVAYKSPHEHPPEPPSRGDLSHTAASKTAITLADVQLFLEEKIDDNIFSLVDAVVNGNHRTGIKLLYEQRRLGEEDLKLFGLFVWQFRVLTQIADLLAREPGLSSDEIAARLKVHPFVVKKNFALARKHSFATFKILYQELLNMDIKIKTGQADQGLVLDTFVATR